GGAPRADLQAGAHAPMPTQPAPARRGDRVDRGTAAALGAPARSVRRGHRTDEGIPTMNSRDIRLQRLIDTTPDVAFRHWVDADARRRWYAPDPGWTAEAETDLRVGGAWRVRFGPTPEEMYLAQGVFEEVDPPRRLVYSSVFRYPDGRSFETR